MSSLRKLSFLTSSRFFLLTLLITLIFFNFLDIFLFKLSRSFPGQFFTFFKDFIDPLSDILDPFNIILLCVLILIFNFNIKSILKNTEKCKIISSKTGFDPKKITNLFDFLSIVCKHFVYSLALAGIMCNILKYIIGVSRPKYFFLEGYERINFFNLEHKINSFPSGHTQAAFTLAILLIIYLNRFIFYILVIATLMGISRIFMSMHFPSDLISGAYLGAIVPIILYNAIYKEKIENIKKNCNISLKDLVRLMYWRIFI